ncbi:hypothetical protein BKA70DRAFT_552551 [Coprinopsis sp. MPI-PUGE-AT-0042]|nr:hypothetical protein BKA70DRAFT_552551 [Coprinopsis sp. MPI-PUGE-AT-0042]
MEFQEHEDILGQPTLPIVPKETGGSYFTVTKSIFALIVLLGLYVVGMRIRREVLIWREKAYKLENRRRHGIPDTDRRPFNVAYAAARRDREEANTSQKPKRALSRPVQQQQQIDSREPQGLTNRSNRLASVAVPGAFVPAYLATPAPRDSMAAPSMPSPSRSAHTDLSSHKRTISASTRSWRHEAESDYNTHDLTSEGDITRDAVYGGDSSPQKMSDIDEDMEWVPSNNHHHKRSAAKRPYADGEDLGSDEDEGVREKRQRKVSLDHSVTMVDVGNGRMEVDEDEYDDDDDEDEVPEITWPTVGSKRGRADAASTFGDDSENEDDTKSLRRHRKKRQMGSRRHSSIGGIFDSKKRGREDDEPTPSEAGTVPRRSKKNKKGVPEDAELWSISSSGRRPRKRQIGEEWESNGIRYKIGPNGQRLRQALVKKARSKFTMPKDSNHPDRNANLEVYVETWLSEAEYKEAKDGRLLAWQEAAKYASNETENLALDTSTARSTPSRPGKNLLWQSTNNTPLGSPIVPGSPLDSPSDITSIRPKGVRTPGRYSMGVATRANPFEKPAASTRRIVSTSLANSISGPANTTSTSLADKTNGKEGGDAAYVRPRNLSKWEKQEVEAQAIARLRALKQAESDAAEKEKKEKERVEKERLEKAERDRKEKEAAAAAAAAPPPKIPTITVTQPSTDSTKPAASSGGFSFRPAPSTNGTAATPASTPSTSTPAAPTSNLFGPPKTATPATPQAEAPKPSGGLFNFKPAAPAAPSAPAASSTPTAATAPSGFSFAPPSSSTPASTTAPSNLFGPQSGDKKDQSQQPAGGFFSKPAGTTATPAASTPAAPSGFSFGPAPSTSGAAPASTPAAAASTTTAPSAAKGFNFAFGPSKSSEPPAAPARSSLAGALGSGAAPQPAASAPSTSGGAPASGSGSNSLFSFKTTGATTPAASTPAAGTTAQGSKSGFAFNAAGGAGSGSAFGPARAPSTSVFGSTPAASSPFGATPTAPSPFGTTSAAAPSKPTAFGTTPTPAVAAGTSSTGFSFGSAGQDKAKEGSAAAAAKPASAFAGFGGASSGTSAFGGASGSTTANPFGAPPSTNAFGSTNGTGNVFGTKPATNGTSNEAPKFAFSTGAGTSTTTPKPSGFTFGTSGATGTSTTTPAGKPSYCLWNDNVQL